MIVRNLFNEDRIRHAASSLVRPPAVIELVMVIGIYQGVAHFLNAFGVELEDGFGGFEVAEPSTFDLMLTTIPPPKFT
jgi:hypothetical protein